MKSDALASKADLDRETFEQRGSGGMILPREEP